jgi:hypothetical protein
MITLRRLLVLLSLSATPLFAYDLIAPRIGPPLYTPSNRSRASAGNLSLASNGFDYLVAWTATGDLIPSTLYTMRVNSDGSLATDLPVPVDPPPLFELPPNPHAISVTPGRDGYFLGWLSDKGLTGAVTDGYGRIEHKTTVAVDNTDGTLAAWNGAAHLVLTTSKAGPFSATVFDNNGDVLATNAPIGDTHLDSRTLLALTGDSAGFLAISTKPTNGPDAIYGRRITSSGVAGDWFLVRSIPYRVTGLSATTDGTHDVIVWGDVVTGIWMMRLDPQTNAAEAPVRLTTDTCLWPWAQVIAKDGRLWVAYTTYRQNPTSLLIGVGSDGTIAQPQPSGGAIATNGTSVLAVRGDFYGTLSTPTGNGAPFLIAKAETQQTQANVAATPLQLLTVWAETVGPLYGSRQIYAARIDALHRLVDPAGVQVSAAGDFSAGYNYSPAAAFNGSNYLIVWTHDAQGGAKVVARRFSPDGTPVGDELLIGDRTHYDYVPRVASDGRGWVVVFVKGLNQPGCGNARRLYAARVSSDGTVLDVGGVEVPSGSDMDQFAPDIGWTGTNYVVAWTNECYVGQPTITWRMSIGAALVAPDLSRVTPLPGSFGVVEWGNGKGTQYLSPRVAAGTSASLIAWQASVDGMMSTQYRVINTAALSTRRRAVGAVASVRSLDGSVIAARRDDTGQFRIYTEMIVPWLADSHQGIWDTVINPDGSAQAPQFRFSLGHGESVSGDVVGFALTQWIAAPFFNIDGGAIRLRLQQF